MGLKFERQDVWGENHVINNLYDYEGNEIGFGPDISFRIESFPGQCGAVVLCDFDFSNISLNQIKALSKEFTEECKRGGDGLKIFVSDVVGGKVHAMVKGHPDWEFGSVSTNPNTGNKIQVFELST